MNSRIILAKNIHIDKQYTNVLDYSEEQMLNLCLENKVAEANNYSFIRANRSINVSFSYNQCLQANYIAFQNPDYSNKWFFAWIDDVIYKGNNNTDITYTIDNWSTWFDYWQKKVCFINRQHVNDDTIGLHTIPENLDVGEVTEEEYEEIMTFGDDGNDYYFAIAGTYNPITNKDFIGVSKINGNLFGSWIFLFDVYSGSVGIPEINNFLADVNNSNKIDSINDMFILPKSLVDAIGTDLYEKDSTFGAYKFKLLKNSDDVVSLPFTFNRTLSFNDYVPKNKKCFVYPYNYMIASNNIGNYNILKYEDFDLSYDVNILEIQMAVSIGVSGRLVPRSYKGVDYNYNESIPLAKFPTCAWSSDAFTNWLTGNAVNVTSQVVNTGVGIATGNVASVAGNVASLIGQFYQASLLPSIQGGQNTGDVNFSDRKNTFALHHMRAKTEYLKIIDDYFTRFGYAIKKLELPNITGRKYWNYIEIGQNEEIGYGEVPSKFMDTINNACRRGVTIWHNHSNIGNFNLDNSII